MLAFILIGFLIVLCIWAFAMCWVAGKETPSPLDERTEEDEI